MLCFLFLFPSSQRLKNTGLLQFHFQIPDWIQKQIQEGNSEGQVQPCFRERVSRSKYALESEDLGR